jgi:hypothetical protein
MALVRLPQFKLPPESSLVSSSALAASSNNRTRALSESLRLIIRRRFGIEAMLLSLADDGRVFVRVSSQLYNRLQDYQRLSQAILQLLSEDTNQTTS